MAHSPSRPAEPVAFNIPFLTGREMLEVGVALCLEGLIWTIDGWLPEPGERRHRATHDLELPDAVDSDRESVLFA